MGKDTKDEAPERPNLTDTSDGLAKQADRPFNELNLLIVVCVLLAIANFTVGLFWPHVSPFDTATFINVAALAVAAGIVLRCVFGAIAAHHVAENALVWERINISQLRELMAQQHAQQMIAMEQAAHQKSAAEFQAFRDGKTSAAPRRFSDFVGGASDDTAQG